MKIIAIAAMSELNRSIGWLNRLPWHIEEDLRHFHSSTWGHTVVMGRNTYNSLPVNNRPLAGRNTIILTNNREKLLGNLDNVTVADSVDSAVKLHSSNYQDSILWVCGGETVYKQFLPLCSEVHLSKIPGHHQGDTFMPEFESQFDLYKTDQKSEFKIDYYRRK